MKEIQITGIEFYPRRVKDHFKKSSNFHLSTLPKEAVNINEARDTYLV